jgi:hypothetical protein
LSDRKAGSGSKPIETRARRKRMPHKADRRKAAFSPAPRSHGGCPLIIPRSAVRSGPPPLPPASGSDWPHCISIPAYPTAGSAVLALPGSPPARPGRLAGTVRSQYRPLLHRCRYRAPGARQAGRRAASSERSADRQRESLARLAAADASGVRVVATLIALAIQVRLLIRAGIAFDLAVLPARLERDLTVLLALRLRLVLRTRGRGDRDRGGDQSGNENTRDHRSAL